MEDDDKLHKNQQPKKFSFVVFPFKTRGRVDKWVQGLLHIHENDCEISCPYTIYHVDIKSDKICLSGK